MFAECRLMEEEPAEEHDRRVNVVTISSSAGRLEKSYSFVCVDKKTVRLCYKLKVTLWLNQLAGHTYIYLQEPNTKQNH